jgi:hypothetical protein
MACWSYGGGSGRNANVNGSAAGSSGTAVVASWSGGGDSSSLAACFGPGGGANGNVCGTRGSAIPNVWLPTWASQKLCQWPAQQAELLKKNMAKTQDVFKTSAEKLGSVAIHQAES